MVDTAAYRDALRESSGDDELADDVVPFSFTSIAELQRIAKELHVRVGDKLVDLGCGLGGPGLWVARKSGASLVGVDVSTEAVAGARRRARGFGVEERSRFVVADMANTGLGAASFDGVMSVDAIPFVDAASIVAEIARLLRPGGSAVLTAFESDNPKRPTVVADYRPYLEGGGLKARTYEQMPNWLERQRSFYAAILRRGERLRAEMGDVAEVLLTEAAEKPSNRRVFIAATKT